MRNSKRIILDIEANNLFNNMLDFSKKPLRLKDTARLWCIGLRDMDDPNIHKLLVLEDCTRENLMEELSSCVELTGHNIVNYDLPVLQAFGLLDYTVGYMNQSATLFGKPVLLTDTLLWSKLLQPDRLGGHSLDSWGKRVGNLKQDFRALCIEKGYITKDSPKGSEFQAYFMETGEYCSQDTSTTVSAYNALMKEKGDWDWTKSYHMELKIIDLTLKQELFGFHFDKELAEECIIDLDEKLKTIADKVNPILPPKKLNKGEQKDFTPPKVQFKKDGSMSAHMLNFIKRLDATIEEDKEAAYLVYEGQKFLLPYNECIKKYTKSDIDDLENLKAYLLSLGWDASEWKIRNLTVDSKKQKLTPEKVEAAIIRYVDNTLNGPFRNERLELLGIEDPDSLLDTLLSKQGAYSIVVPVSPMIRIGTDKKLCPNLEKLGEKADFAFDVTQYLTYKHRRNSIAGGQEDEDGEPLTGYLSLVREDGRVSTPADTCSAATGRMKHRGINIAVPR